MELPIAKLHENRQKKYKLVQTLILYELVARMCITSDPYSFTTCFACSCLDRSYFPVLVTSERGLCGLGGSRAQNITEHRHDGSGEEGSCRLLLCIEWPWVRLSQRSVLRCCDAAHLEGCRHPRLQATGTPAAWGRRCCCCCC